MANMAEHRRRMATMVCRYLPAQGPSAMYEIGAGPPTKAEWKYIQRKYPKMKLVGCEPHPPTYEKVKPHFDGDLWPVAIHSTLKSTSIRSHSDGEVFGSHTILNTDNRSAVIEDIPCMTLDDFDDLAGNPETVLLWMDNEGSELDCLKSGPELMKSGRVICINLEVRDKAGIEGWPTATELEQYLNTIGYRLVRNYNNQRTHWDAIYVPERSPYPRKKVSG